MLEKVDLVFNYGGRWVLKPHVIYIKNLNHVLQGYDVDMLSYIDICAEYTEVLKLREVKQILVTGSSVDEDDFDDVTGDGDEDEDPDLRPVVISKAWTMLQQRKLHQKPTGIRKISFKGDGTGINLPTNLPYSPKKVT
ncbi:hypothetical protein A4A49_53195 [Nicotiana attenuata]|uniref:Uncharacterized protein n=1 Tax=Nicotiana attenuata TaxID=49451 RepID=A0A314KHE8_NICAT|nr:hypothetical protein A4A49_53195 [Nicotiana attenuata]